MKVKKLAMAFGVVAGGTLLGSGVGTAAGAGIDYYFGMDRAEDIQEATAAVEDIESSVAVSETRQKEIKQYGSACIQLVTHYSFGGVLHDKPEEVATANIAKEPGSPCGTSATEVLVAYKDISGALEQRHNVSKLNYDDALEHLTDVESQQQNDSDFNGLLYGLPIGGAIGLTSASILARNKVIKA